MTESLFEQIAHDREIEHSKDRLIEDVEFVAVVPHNSAVGIWEVHFQPPPDPAAKLCTAYLDRARARDAERNRRQHLETQR